MIKQLKLESASSQINKSIKENMYQRLVLKLIEFTRAFKLNEERYVQKFNELNFNENALFNSTEQEKYESNFQQFKLDAEFTHKSLSKYDILKEKTNELDEILNSLHELTDIFKEAEIMVENQGLLLDRIDDNINEGRDNVQKGNKELTEAKETLSNGCVKTANNTLMIIIVILSILILLKIII